jgi:hypothetical protein
MADLKKGDFARVRPVVIAGQVVRHRFDEVTGEKFLRLSWKDASGEPHEREFPVGDLEADPAMADAGEAAPAA